MPEVTVSAVNEFTKNYNERHSSFISPIAMFEALNHMLSINDFMLENAFNLYFAEVEKGGKANGD